MKAHDDIPDIVKAAESLSNALNNLAAVWALNIVIAECRSNRRTFAETGRDVVEALKTIRKGMK